SLAGVGTEEAMEMRERLLKEGVDKNCIANSLAGVGTKEAMEMRERLLKEGANVNYIARSLAGVGTKEAMAFRKKYFTDPTLMAKSFSTNDAIYDGVICRYGYEK
ncbi:hypothetical protein HY249_01730, partial [Candidatus Azambacteria bacterium]|nr:hypothetical protein [Candidatus Azambacteria bacterium]